MLDLWHTVTRWLDHNRGAVVACVIAALLAAYLIGCEVTTQSLVDPDRQVTARQLHHESLTMQSSFQKRRSLLDAQIESYNADVEQFNEQLDAAAEHLQQQQAMRQRLVETAGGFAADAVTGSFNPLSAIASLVSLMSLGAAAGFGFDNLRKNRVIEQLKGKESEVRSQDSGVGVQQVLA